MEALILVITLLLIICYIVAWFLTMQIVTEAAMSKGYGELVGKLWFIGLFGLIFTPPIIVASLPDRKVQAAVRGESNIEDELPSI